MPFQVDHGLLKRRIVISRWNKEKAVQLEMNMTRMRMETRKKSELDPWRERVPMRTMTSPKAILSTPFKCMGITGVEKADMMIISSIITVSCSLLLTD
jgi:hypothetical protein